MFRLGDSPARVHIVRDGAIELSREACGRRVALQILRAGDEFGDIPLLVGTDEPFDARVPLAVGPVDDGDVGDGPEPLDRDFAPRSSGPPPTKSKESP